MQLLRSRFTLLSAMVLFCAASVALGGGQAPEKAADSPSTRPVAPKVPRSVIDEIKAQFKRPTQRLSRDKMRALMVERFTKVLALGAETEKKYPKASNLHDVRRMMLNAAGYFANTKRDAASVRKMLDIAGRINKSDAPAEVKLEASVRITQNRVKPIGGGDPVKDLPKEIRSFVSSFEKTDSAGKAALYGMILAQRSDQAKLADELVELMQAKYSSDPRIRRVLRQMGKISDVGKPFAAELTRLDGSTLSLPDDLKGKVLVIDFWATWCGPCVAEVPKMKKIYATYKSKGVEFVGISLDESRSALTDFIKTKEMGWIHTFSGKGWKDPTARKYGVSGIPSIWIVGKDGKVFSSNARDNLKATIEKALAVPIVEEKKVEGK